ncbi:amino acid transporter, putative [Trypanosoma cruzi]|nr:amino acid transporter, putative [Trypanosoma cruzi]
MKSNGNDSVCEGLLRESRGLRQGEFTGRQSLTSRISMNVARRLSVIGAAEESRTATVSGAAINTLCNVIGAGVLSLPLAICEASVVGALVLMFYTAILSGFAVFAVVAACDATQRFSFTEAVAFVIFPSLNFEEFCTMYSFVPSEGNVEPEKGTMELDNLRRCHKEDEILRRKRRRILMVLVESVIFLNNYGGLVIYSRVIADSIPPVVKNFLHGSGFFVTRIFWLLTSGVVFFCLSCVRNMDELKWTSILGFLTIFYIVLTVVARYFTSCHTPPYPNIDPADRGEINWYHVGTGIFRAISTYGVAFGYHYNVPYFYRELKDRRPSTMMKTVYVAFPIIVFCYAATGLFGYLTFGNLVTAKTSGGDIVRNYPDDDPVVNVGRLGLFFHFACVYPILSVCARRGFHRILMNALTWCSQTDIIEPGRDPEQVGRREREYTAVDVTGNMSIIGPDRDVGSPEDTTRLAIVLEALFLVTTTVAIAAAVSGISVVIDFFGALFGVFLMLTCPGLIAWFLFSRAQLLRTSPYRFARLLMALSVLLIFTGIVFSVVGVAFIIKNYTT